MSIENPYAQVIALQRRAMSIDKLRIFQDPYCTPGGVYLLGYVYQHLCSMRDAQSYCKLQRRDYVYRKSRCPQRPIALQRGVHMCSTCEVHIPSSLRSRNIELEWLL